MPVVAVVGRPNVGKSSLLNALLARRISIVQDMPGVTRDRISAPLEVAGRFMELVDTGGYGFEDPDNLTEHIRRQIEQAMAGAQLVILVVDVQSGLTSADEQIAALLRKQGLNVLLVGNKADGARVDAGLGEFARLGLGTPMGVSALTGRNVAELKTAIGERVDLSAAPSEIPPPRMHVAIVGKRNAGKSTLVNTIGRIFTGQDNRVIVSEVPGTTRDSIDVRFDKDGQSLVVIDTAGVRKKRHMVTNDTEFYSFHRAQRSIRRADVVLMLMDATQTVSEPDKKLADYIARQFKPVVLVMNKWDLARKQLHAQTQTGEAIDDTTLKEKFREYLHAQLRHLTFAPIAFVTAAQGNNVQAVLSLAQHLYTQTNQRISTGRLNRAVRQVLDERAPSTTSGRRAKVYYATQTDVAPPTLVLFVNKPQYLDDSYQRFVINRLRDLLPYPEVPIKLLVRARQSGDEAPPEVTDEDSPSHLREAENRMPFRGRPPRNADRPRAPRSPKARESESAARSGRPRRRK